MRSERERAAAAGGRSRRGAMSIWMMVARPPTLNSLPGRSGRSVAVIMSSLWRFVCHGHWPWPGSSPADRCHLPNWPTGRRPTRAAGQAEWPPAKQRLTPPIHCRRDDPVYLYSLSALQPTRPTASRFNFLHIFEDSVRISVLSMKRTHRAFKQWQERQRERQRATSNIDNCITNRINVTCGRLPEKANAQQAGHLVKIELRKKYSIHTKSYRPMSTFCHQKKFDLNWLLWNVYDADFVHFQAFGICTLHKIQRHRKCILSACGFWMLVQNPMQNNKTEKCCIEYKTERQKYSDAIYNSNNTQ